MFAKGYKPKCKKLKTNRMKNNTKPIFASLTDKSNDKNTEPIARPIKYNPTLFFFRCFDTYKSTNKRACLVSWQNVYVCKFDGTLFADRTNIYCTQVFWTKSLYDWTNGGLTLNL